MSIFLNRRVLVVGASAGIGAGLARRLAGQGAEVHLAARRRDRLDAHVQAIRGEGGSAFGHACDLASADSVAELFATVGAHGAEISTVINTAATLWLEPFATQPEEHWRAIIDTNLVGAIRLTQHALAHMLPRGSGHIVHLTSTAATIAIPHLAIYATTKAGLAHFLTAMRGEYGKSGVRFTEIQIGNTAGTEGGGAVFHETTEASLAHVMRWTGIPSMLNVDDVVEAVVYALSTPQHVRLDRVVLRETADIPS